MREMLLAVARLFEAGIGYTPDYVRGYAAWAKDFAQDDTPQLGPFERAKQAYNQMCAAWGAAHEDNLSYLMFALELVRLRNIWWLSGSEREKGAFLTVHGLAYFSSAAAWAYTVAQCCEEEDLRGRAEAAAAACVAAAVRILNLREEWGKDLYGKLEVLIGEEEARACLHDAHVARHCHIFLLLDEVGDYEEA